MRPWPSSSSGQSLLRTVNLGLLAQHFCHAALPASNCCRLQRFFLAIRIDPATLARLLIRITHLRPPWHLALDRTNWRFGNTPINLLVLAMVTRRVRLLILFIVLGKTGCELRPMNASA